jgi:hypothetical protein
MVAKGEMEENVKEVMMEAIVKKTYKTQAKQPQNKGGAPKKNVKRELIIRIRMSATERFIVDEKAKKAGMRSSSWIRAAAKSAKIIPRLTNEERRILWMLAELANNLNQLTKLAHQLGLLTVVRECSKLLSEIDSMIKRLNKNDRESDNR